MATNTTTSESSSLLYMKKVVELDYPDNGLKSTKHTGQGQTGTNYIIKLITCSVHIPVKDVFVSCSVVKGLILKTNLLNFMHELRLSYFA